MKLTVGFLCYNQSSSPYLKLFLESLELSLRAWGGEAKLLAGDNSDDGTSTNQDIVQSHNKTAHYIVDYIDFKKNLGFASAYNKLIAKAAAVGSEYFLMLNPDMLIDERAVKVLVKTLDESPEVAVVCPKILRWDFSNNQKTVIIDSCGIMMKPGLRFYDLGQGQKDNGRFDDSRIFGASGAAGLFKMSALYAVMENSQYFDERFFMYKEDCDLAYRLNRAGCVTKFSPEALIYHDRSVAAKGACFKTFLDWRRRSRLTRSWSFVNQHLIFLKFWTREAYYSRFIICIEVIFYLFFSLIFAQFLLRTYPAIWRKYRVLTNIK